MSIANCQDCRDLHVRIKAGQAAHSDDRAARDTLARRVLALEDALGAVLVHGPGANARLETKKTFREAKAILDAGLSNTETKP